MYIPYSLVNTTEPTYIFQEHHRKPPGRYLKAERLCSHWAVESCSSEVARQIKVTVPPAFKAAREYPLSTVLLFMTVRESRKKNCLQSGNKIIRFRCEGRMNKSCKLYWFVSQPPLLLMCQNRNFKLPPLAYLSFLIRHKRNHSTPFASKQTRTLTGGTCVG